MEFWRIVWIIFKIIVDMNILTSTYTHNGSSLTTNTRMT